MACRFIWNFWLPLISGVIIWGLTGCWAYWLNWLFVFYWLAFFSNPNTSAASRGKISRVRPISLRVPQHLYFRLSDVPDAPPGFFFEFTKHWNHFLSQVVRIIMTIKGRSVGANKTFLFGAFVNLLMIILCMVLQWVTPPCHRSTCSTLGWLTGRRASRVKAIQV